MAIMFNSNVSVVDNKVVISNQFGSKQYLLSDENATKLMGILDGMVSNQSGSSSVVSSTVTTHSVGSTTTTSSIKPLKNVGYHIDKHGKLFCISRGSIIKKSAKGFDYYTDGGYTTSERSCINASIKALDGIEESSDKSSDGKNYKVWGYKTKKKAEEMMATLPTEFSSEEISKFVRVR